LIKTANRENLAYIIFIFKIQRAKVQNIPTVTKAIQASMISKKCLFLAKTVEKAILRIFLFYFVEK